VNLEYYSNLAFVGSVVVYALAMLAHAAEWATARKVDSDASTQKIREPALAAVGAGESAANDHAAVVSTETGLIATPPSEGAARRRVDQFGRVGIALTIIGLGLSVLGVVLRGLTAHRAPWGNMFEFTTAAMVFVVAVYLIMVWRVGLRWLGLPVTLLATIGNGLAVTVFYVAVAPLVPALHSVWFLIHIVAAAIAGAAFNVGGLMAILYLIKKRAEDRGQVRGYLTRLPFPALDLHRGGRRHLGRIRLGPLLGLGPEGDLGPSHLGDLRLLLACALDRGLARQPGGADRHHRASLFLVQLRRHQSAGQRTSLLRRRLREPLESARLAPMSTTTTPDSMLQAPVLR
jgi:hypothetical protein